MLLTSHIACPSDEDAVSSQGEEAEEDEVEHAEDLVDQRWARARCASHLLPLVTNCCTSQHAGMQACGYALAIHVLSITEATALKMLYTKLMGALKTTETFWQLWPA